MIDLYCERTAAGFWNEPVNAISNAGFVLAAIWAWHRRRRRGSGDTAEAVLILSAGSIGVGSFLFHTFANRWSELADIVPIWSFVALYVLLIIHRFTGQNLLKTVRIGLIATISGFALSLFTGNSLLSSAEPKQQWLNGSLQYAPALMALIVFSILAWVRAHAIRHALTLATAIFCVALFLRTIDHQICDISGGLGSHFLWHLLNALMIAVLLHVMIERLPPAN